MAAPDSIPASGDGEYDLKLKLIIRMRNNEALNDFKCVIFMVPNRAILVFLKLMTYCGFYTKPVFSYTKNCQKGQEL